MSSYTRVVIYKPFCNLSHGRYMFCSSKSPKIASTTTSSKPTNHHHRTSFIMSSTLDFNESRLKIELLFMVELMLVHLRRPSQNRRLGKIGVRTSLIRSQCTEWTIIRLNTVVKVSWDQECLPGTVLSLVRRVLLTVLIHMYYLVWVVTYHVQN